MQNTLRELRKQKGMTQTELAMKSNVPRICIVRYEAGLHQPSIANARKLATALNVTIDELTGADPDQLADERQGA